MIALLAAIALAPGDTVAPFEPFWVSGEYKDTTMCPVCEYGMRPMVQVWTQGEPASELPRLVKLVDTETALAGSGTVYSFLVDANSEDRDESSKNRLSYWNSKWGTKNVSFLVRGSNLKVTLENYKLTDKAGWSTVVYTIKNRKVVDTFVNPKPEEFEKIRTAMKNLVKA